MNKKYSIKDIARLSGVSTATVSRVINKKGKYSKETEKKVLEIINKTGYKINTNAQSLRTNISKTIGILVPDINNYFFSTIVQKIENLLFTRGYSTIICNTDRSIEKEEIYLRMLEEKNVDALVIISGNSNTGFEFNGSNKNIPYICIDREPLNFTDTIFISSNHLQGGIDATQSLISNGSKTPAIVIHNKYSISSNSRLEGFKKALNDNDLDFSNTKNLVVLDLESENDKTLTSHLNKYPDIDGLFVTNDNLAIKVLKILETVKINIPEKIQVIGFDGIPAAEYTSPTLSTIKQNTSEIARLAVENLIESINGIGKKGSTIVVPTETIQRETTKNK